MATLNYVLRKRAESPDGKYQLVVRVRNGRTVSDIPLSTDYRFTPEQWDDLRQVVTSKHKQAHRLNFSLMERRLDLNERMEKEFGLMPKASAQIIARRLASVRGETESKVISVFKEFIDIKDVKSTKDSFTYTMRKIIEYDTLADQLQFDDITLDWVRKFYKWLLKSLSVNTSAIHMENLRAVVNYAIREELTCKYAFKDFEIPREKVVKPVMEPAELRALWNYPGANFHEQYYLDIFKLIFALCGINVKDLYYLTKKNVVNGRLEYNRQKTGVHVSVKIEPEAMEIFQKYPGRGEKLLDIADRYADHKNFIERMNKSLKKIGPFHWEGHYKVRERCLWPNASTYMARRSWATIGSGPCEVPIDTLALGMGHADSRMTAVYIRPYLKKLDTANRKILDYVLYNDEDDENDCTSDCHVASMFVIKELKQKGNNKLSRAR